MQRISCCLVILGQLGATSWAQQQSSSVCRDVLADQLKNRISFNSGSAFASNMQAWMCSQRNSTSRSSNSGGLSVGVPIDGVPLQFGGNLSGSDANSWFNAHCDQKSQTMSDQQAESVSLALLPPDAIQAWSRCIDRTTPTSLQRLGMSPTTNASRLTITITWQPDAIRLDPPVVNQFLVAGATCENPLRANDRLSGSQAIICTRLANQETVVVLNTNQGSPPSINLPAFRPLGSRDQLLASLQSTLTRSFHYEADGFDFIFDQRIVGLDTNCVLAVSNHQKVTFSQNHPPNSFRSFGPSDHTLDALIPLRRVVGLEDDSDDDNPPVRQIHLKTTGSDIQLKHTISSSGISGGPNGQVMNGPPKPSEQLQESDFALIVGPNDLTTVHDLLNGLTASCKQE